MNLVIRKVLSPIIQEKFPANEAGLAIKIFHPFN